MEAVRSGGDLKNIGGSSQYCKDIVCADGCVLFRLTAKPLGKENFYTGNFWTSLKRPPLVRVLPLINGERFLIGIMLQRVSRLRHFHG